MLCAVIAKQESSLAWLMHPSQREATADVVNSALLAAAVAKCSGQASASSRQPKPQVRVWAISPCLASNDICRAF